MLEDNNGDHIAFKVMFVLVCDAAERNVLARCVTISIGFHEATISLECYFAAFCMRALEHFPFAEGIFGMHLIGNFNGEMHMQRQKEMTTMEFVELA